MKARKNKSEINPVEEGLAEDKKRAFLATYGPDCHIWNFEEEDNPTPHVMRNKADPAKAYVDGRIEEMLGSIEKLAEHLKTHSGETWEQLIKYVVQIFIEQEKLEASEYAEWSSTQ